METHTKVLNIQVVFNYKKKLAAYKLHVLLLKYR